MAAKYLDEPPLKEDTREDRLVFATVIVTLCAVSDTGIPEGLFNIHDDIEELSIVRHEYLYDAIHGDTRQ